MCGLNISEKTTFGAGQVLEFYVNFGVSGLVIGFLLFGFIYGWIDRKATLSLQNGNFGAVFVWFLSAMALNAPLASIPQMMGNIAAALVAAFGWRYAWNRFNTKAALEMCPDKFRKRLPNANNN
jgi:hypothetical protein